MIKKIVLIFFASLIFSLPTFTSPQKAGAVGLGEVTSGVVREFGVQDSHGNDLNKFELSVNEGNITNSKGISASISEMTWNIYLSPIKALMWILDWATEMTWINWFLTPLKGVAAGVDSIRNAIGLKTLVFTISAFIIGVWLLRGRVAQGVSELIVCLLIAGATTAFFADPVQMIIGENGWVSKAKNISTEIANELNSAGDPNASLSSNAADAMIRNAHQAVNYGAVIKEGDCIEIYDKNLGTEDAFGKLKDCSNTSYYERADSTPFGMVGDSIMLYLPGIVFGIFTFVIILSLFAAVAYASLQAILLIWSLLLGMIPGSSRAGLIKNFMGAVASWIMIVVVLVFLGVWMRLIAAFFSDDGMPFFVKCLLFAGALIIGCFAIVKFWNPIKEWVRNLGEKVASLTSASSPSSVGGTFKNFSPKQLSVAGAKMHDSKGQKLDTRSKRQELVASKKEFKANHIEASLDDGRLAKAKPKKQYKAQKQLDRLNQRAERLKSQSKITSQESRLAKSKAAGFRRWS